MSGYAPIQSDSIEPDSPPPTRHIEIPLKPAQAPSHAAAPPAKPAGGFYSASFYNQFFDINTEEFIGKIVLALNPFNNASEVSAQTEEGPTELYGFIWINATLVFLMFVSATGSNMLAQWLHGSDTTEKYEYDFRLLTLSVSIFYGYTVLVPVLLFLYTKFFANAIAALSLTRLISIYSYANVPWIPTTAINVVLAVFVSSSRHHTVLNISQWSVAAVSGALSGMSIIFKVRSLIGKNGVAESVDPESNTGAGKLQYPLIFAALALAHVGFTVLIKVSFFGIA